LEDQGLARQDDTSKPAPTVQLTESRERVAPFWARIPRGWIIVALFLLAWLGIFLIWNGLRLLAHL
jgi:hypothetical protein